MIDLESILVEVAISYPYNSRLEIEIELQIVFGVRKTNTVIPY